MKLKEITKQPFFHWISTYPKSYLEEEISLVVSSNDEIQDIKVYVKDNLLGIITVDDLDEEMAENLWEESQINGSLRLKEEILEYENEAFDKVWYYRHKDSTAAKKIPQAWRDEVDQNPDDWSCGFWNGVLATTRWVLGEQDKKMLDC